MSKKHTRKESSTSDWPIAVGGILILLISLGLIFTYIFVHPLDTLQRTAMRQNAYESAVDVAIGDPTQDAAFYWQAKRVERIVEQNLGATVIYGDPPDGAAGVTYTAERKIIIEAKAGWTARYEILCHEAGHLLEPTLSSRWDGEIFAQAVAYVVELHDGDPNALRQSAHYLAGAKSSLHVLTEYRAEILRAAKFLE